MRSNNYFVYSKIHIKRLQYCFGSLIKYELQTIQKEQNTHTIRNQKGRICRKPDLIYFSPETYNLKDYKKSCNIEGIDDLLDKFTVKPELNDPKFIELIEIILPGTRIPLDIKEAFDLYKKLSKQQKKKEINAHNCQELN